MGLEAKCTCRLNDQSSVGKAHCGDGEITFSGDFKLRWRWSDLASAESFEGQLVVTRKGDRASFELGDASEKWLHQIQNPKSRLDKIGLKPGMSYQVWGEFDAEFRPELEVRAGGESTAPADIVFVHVESHDDLPTLLKAREAIKQNGMIWAVWTKGRKEFREDDIRAFALQNGLVDVKVAKFSETLSSLKLVIPVALRKS